jgi:hypothetical protein
MRERRSSCRILVGIYEGKRPLGRLGRKWESNIGMDLQKWYLGPWTRLIRLRTGTGGGLL